MVYESWVEITKKMAILMRECSNATEFLGVSYFETIKLNWLILKKWYTLVHCSVPPSNSIHQDQPLAQLLYEVLIIASRCFQMLPVNLHVGWVFGWLCSILNIHSYPHCCWFMVVLYPHFVGKSNRKWVVSLYLEDHST